MAVGYYGDYFVQYPHKIKILKELIPELRCFHDSVVEAMYVDYSQSWYCAGFMDLDLKHNLETFRMYLFTDLVTYPTR